MSSDTYVIEVLARDGAVVRLRAAMTGAQDFAGMPYPGGRAFFVHLAFEHDREGAIAQDLRVHADALGRQPIDLLLDGGWMKENIDRHVSEVVLERVRVFDMDAGRAEEQRFGHWLHELVWGPRADALFFDAFLEHAPSFDCRVQFARAEYADSFRVGDRFGTTAFAAFEEPPWSTPKLRNAPDWVVDEFQAGPDGHPVTKLEAPARAAKRRA